MTHIEQIFFAGIRKVKVWKWSCYTIYKTWYLIESFEFALFWKSMKSYYYHSLFMHSITLHQIHQNVIFRRQSIHCPLKMQLKIPFILFEVQSFWCMQQEALNSLVLRCPKDDYPVFSVSSLSAPGRRSQAHTDLSSKLFTLKNCII